MNEHQWEAIGSLYAELSPAHREEVLLFVLARVAQNKANLKPITPQEWHRLPWYVRRVIYWYACICFFSGGLAGKPKNG